MVRRVQPVEGQHNSDDTAIGVEIGARGLRAVVTERSGRLVDQIHGIAPRANAGVTVESAFGLIDQLIERRAIDLARIAGIGVAFGGPVDTRRGITITSSRAEGFEEFPLASVIEDRYGIQTVIENDARAAALGEYRFGAGRGARTMIYIQLGIGVGGGIVLDGRLHHGTAMTAGEFGHMPVTADGPRCSCGKPGHLEAYISESAIVDRMRERLIAAPPDVTARWLSGGGISVRRIFTSEDDELAAEVANDAIRMTGLALANLVTALSSDAVVIGGYAIDLGDEFINRVRARIRQHAFEAAARRLTVSYGQLGQNAAVAGATALVFSSST